MTRTLSILPVLVATLLSFSSAGHAALLSRGCVACATFGGCGACDACAECEPDVVVAKPACKANCGDRPQDQIFLLSTRHLGCGSHGMERPNWQVWLRADNRWLNSHSDAIYAPQPGVRTVIYVHGNRVDSNYAVEGGLRVYRNLIPCADDSPIRFIIWSWCADQIKGPIKDARVKADVADSEAVLFGRFLARFEEDDHVGLIGFSYGARIITGGVHLIGGGAWCGRHIADPSIPNFHITLWAAAEGNDWLLPHGYHHAAVPICGDWLIAFNCCDRALKNYHVVEKHTQALGYTGLYASALGSYANGIKQMQVSNLVGCEHKSEVYPLSPGMMAATRAVVLRPSPVTIVEEVAPPAAAPSVPEEPARQ